MKHILTYAIIIVCALSSGAQTLTHRYLELADSADNYMKQELWADAERNIIAALRHEPANPSNWLLWSNLGVVRTHLDNYPGALEAYEIGMAGAPKSTVLLSNRAWTHLYYGHDKEALSDLNRTLQLDSLQAWPLKMRGLSRLAKHDTADAMADLQRSDSIAGGDAAVIAGIGDALIAMGHNDEAAAKYEASIKIQEDPEVYYKLLLILTTADSYLRNATEVQERTVSALGKWPTHAGLHIVRAIQQKKNFQNDAAEHEKKLAIEYGADPHMIDLLINSK